jgi:nitrite reductase/ring-hydroxylating ferredoxin subunit
MDRHKFLKTCGYTCLGIVGLTSFLDSCIPTKLVQTTSNTGLLIIPKTEFIEEKNNKLKSLKHILIQTPELFFPIALYRFSDTEFSAILLKCSHQGIELNVMGDLISCPAHGSEFSNTGEIIQGPAESSLTTFRVSTDSNKIFIHLA